MQRVIIESKTTNMKRVVLHHTCSQKGGKDYVLENAPFLAKNNAQNRKFQFLGEGYYLWENDIEQAKYWGKVHYDNSFFIVEFEYDIEDKLLLDLNAREGQRTLYKIIDTIQKEVGLNLKNWPLSKLLSFIYRSNINFIYKSIKVKDEFSSRRRQEIFKFTSVKDNFTYIGGVYFYFFRNKDDMNIISKNIV